jgi:capsular exopolysaccharide synthesis family protein
MALFAKKPAPKKPTAPAEPRDPVVTVTDPKSATAEAYRTVRTNLQFTGLDQPKKSILVTSAGPGEGKSTTVANLGVTMAMAGTRTLLVDSDLRRPVLHKLFNLPNTIGLTTVLANTSAAEQSIAAARLPGLFVLPSGPIPPNPAEVLSCRRMLEFAEAAKTQYDLVLYDSPPVISLSDSLILSSYTEGVILVVKCGQYASDLIRQAKAQLEGVKASFLGVLLNSVDFRRNGYYYRYYYRYYYDPYGAYGSHEGAK